MDPPSNKTYPPLSLNANGKSSIHKLIFQWENHRSTNGGFPWIFPWRRQWRNGPGAVKIAGRSTGQSRKSQVSSPGMPWEAAEIFFPPGGGRVKKTASFSQHFAGEIIVNHSKSNTHHCDSLWFIVIAETPTIPNSTIPVLKNSPIKHITSGFVVGDFTPWKICSSVLIIIPNHIPNGAVVKKDLWINQPAVNWWILVIYIYISTVYPHYIPILESLHIRVELNKECLTPPTSKNHRSMDNGLNLREHLQETMDFPMKSW